MPVEIKELIIRAVVEPRSGPGVPRPKDDLSDAHQQEIVQTCVREVLRILKRSEER
jgi:Family of unknown function (DUF5908)